nr:hypothetical protein [Micromonospora sp. DSM 115978]
DEAIYATGDDQGEVALWRLADGGRVERLSSVAAHDDRVFALDVDGAGELLATSSFGEVSLWDVADPSSRPELLADVPVEEGGSAFSVAFSPDGARLATGGPDGDVTLWDVSDPDDPVSLATDTDGHRANSFVRAVQFSPDGSTLTSVAEDRNVINRDVSGDELDEISRLPTTVGKLNALAYSPDGSVMAAGGDGRVVYLYDVTDPAAPREITKIAPHDGAIWALDFSPDGRTLAAGGSDVRLWDVSDTAAPAPAGDFTFLPANRVHFTPDGRYLLPLTGAAALLPYDLDVNAISDKICDLVGAPITEEEWSQYLPDMDYDPPCD